MAKQHLFGPYFFPSTVTGDYYRAILSEFFLQDLLHQVEAIENVWFQQDGDPAHTAILTRELLTSVFETRIISREFQHEWLPRSPDLTPCDYYLWGVVKEIVYKDGIIFANVLELMEAVIQAFQKIRQEKMDGVKNAVQSVRRRMEECVMLGGCQLYHC